MVMRNPLPYQGSRLAAWYGADPVWRGPMEARAFREFQGQITRHVAADSLTYSIPEFGIPGGPKGVSITIRFDRYGQPRHFGLPARDMPTVTCRPEVASPHRNPDGSMCLWFPADPPDKRWQSEQGLDCLVGIVANHLFAEYHWAKTGGHNGGEWLLDEACHGFPEEERHARRNRRR